MAILAFQKPDKVVMLEADEQYGKFEFRPLFTLTNISRTLSKSWSFSS